MKNISFFLTQKQLLDGTKTVTRRLGWKRLEPGTLLCAVEKGQGLKKGEKIHRLAIIEITDVRLEQLDKIILIPEYGMREVRREGFPDKTPEWFIDHFCKFHKGCRPDSIITKIEFKIFR